jgi:hypothetical protein
MSGCGLNATEIQQRLVAIGEASRKRNPNGFTSAVERRLTQQQEGALPEVYAQWRRLTITDLVAPGEQQKLEHALASCDTASVSKLVQSATGKLTTQAATGGMTVDEARQLVQEGAMLTKALFDCTIIDCNSDSVVSFLVEGAPHLFINALQHSPKIGDMLRSRPELADTCGIILQRAADMDACVRCALAKASCSSSAELIKTLEAQRLSPEDKARCSALTSLVRDGRRARGVLGALEAAAPDADYAVKQQSLAETTIRLEALEAERIDLQEQRAVESARYLQLRRLRRIAVRMKYSPLYTFAACSSLSPRSRLSSPAPFRTSLGICSEFRS